MALPRPYAYYLEPLERAEIPYCVTRSVAAGVYGHIRTTHDIDLVLLLKIGEIAKFRAAFPESEYYVPPDEVLITELRRGQRGCLHLYHHESGFKADLFFVVRDPLHVWAMKNRRRVDSGDEKLWIAPPEYVLLRKLEFFREGRQDKLIEDMRFNARRDEDGSEVHYGPGGATRAFGSMERTPRSVSRDGWREFGLTRTSPFRNRSVPPRLRLPFL